MVGVSAANQNYFKQYALWIANYGVSKPMIPAPWKDGEWLLWQYTDKGDGLQYGVETLNVDMNYFNGDENAFNKRFGLTGSPEPEPPTSVYPVEMVVTMSDGTKEAYTLTKK
jgi:GH25 family lysozyme M1 (1,4-beta-N-acetylmuramidase)